MNRPTCSRVKEKCGIVAIYFKREAKNLSLALLAAGGIQHRGQQGAGIVLQTKKGLLSHKDKGLLKDIFTKRAVSRLDKKCRFIIIHCRYGTHGNYNKINLQPCIAEASSGQKLAVAHNGEFVGVEENFSGESDTYLFTQKLSSVKYGSWDKKIVNLLKEIKGAYSLVIGVGQRLYIARDKFGLRPLVLGKIKNGWIVASETHALFKIGASIEREIKKGEIVKIDPAGIKILQSESKGSSHFCDFEWAYFSRPDSSYPIYNRSKTPKSSQDWPSFAAFRERCGKILAQEVDIPNASFVVGVPDSGIHVGVGYASEKSISYRQTIIRDHHDPNGLERLFMRDDQIKSIGKKVLGKLSLTPDRQIWQDATVVIADDSIIRGNVSSNITKAVFSLGARQVHWLVGFPPVAYPCHLGVSMRSRDELIATRFNSNPQKIAQAIGATSVSYISYQGFVKAKKLSAKVKVPVKQKEIFLQNGGCGGCVTGIYPLDRKGNIWREKKRLAVLIGSGSRLPAIYNYVKKSNFYEIAAVISYKKRSPKIAWAKKQAIPALYHRWIDYKNQGKTRKEYNQDLVKILKSYQVDLVFGVGWDIIWTANFLRAFPDQVLNAHPFPLPDGDQKTIVFNGKKVPVLHGMNMLKRAWEKKLPITGACVHFARETVDVGPVLVRDILPINKGESFDQLEKRHCQFEGKVLVRALKLLAENRVNIVDERVVIK